MDAGKWWGQELWTDFRDGHKARRTIHCSDAALSRFLVTLRSEARGERCEEREDLDFLTSNLMPLISFRKWGLDRPLRSVTDFRKPRLLCCHPVSSRSALIRISFFSSVSPRDLMCYDVGGVTPPGCSNSTHSKRGEHMLFSISPKTKRSELFDREREMNELKRGRGQRSSDRTRRYSWLPRNFRI